MDLKIVASGSKGNVVAVISEEVILIDLGIPKTKAEKKLLENGIAFKDVSAVLITHSHQDHCKGLPLADKYKTPVYASEGTFKTINPVNSHVVQPGMKFKIGCFIVEPFDAHHDDYQAFGYTLIDKKGDKASVLFDTGKVTDEMINAMSNSNFYVIESNHEPGMVEVSDYPNSVKARVVSDIGHLSNEQTAEVLKQLIQGVGERIYLTHLSGNNNLPALAEMTVKRALKQKGYVAGRDYKIEVI